GPSIQEVAARFERAPAAVQEFLRRSLPRGERPWTEKPRWAADEIEALQRDAAKVPTRSLAAIRKYIKRHAPKTVGDSPLNEEVDRSALTVTQVAQDLGLSSGVCLSTRQIGRSAQIQRSYRRDVVQRSLTSPYCPMP